MQDHSNLGGTEVGHDFANCSESRVRMRRNRGMWELENERESRIGPRKVGKANEPTGQVSRQSMHWKSPHISIKTGASELPNEFQGKQVKRSQSKPIEGSRRKSPNWRSLSSYRESSLHSEEERGLQQCRRIPGKGIPKGRRGQRHACLAKRWVQNRLSLQPIAPFPFSATDRNMIDKSISANIYIGSVRKFLL